MLHAPSDEQGHRLALVLSCADCRVALANQQQPSTHLFKATGQMNTDATHWTMDTLIATVFHVVKSALVAGSKSLSCGCFSCVWCGVMLSLTIVTVSTVH